MVQTPTDWIEWQGGNRPVPKATIVQVYFRADQMAGMKPGAYPPCGADDLEWGRPFGDGGEGDIIAYRVVQS